MADQTQQLELICIGRTCVDLYGEQIGAPLQTTQSFRKYVGGSASNICIGAARLGIRTAMIARVGDEPLGQYVRATFEAEGVDIQAVRYDRERLTALIALAIRKSDDFPRIFFYENAADMALSEDDIDETLVASAKVLLVTGTHFSQLNLDKASNKAIRAAKRAGRRVAFDIDYRPVLWGLTGHARGAAMFIESDRVSEHLQRILPHCDLVVGTEEEICIAGGSDELHESLRRIRSLTEAAIVCKRGAQGSIVYPTAIPANLDDGVTAASFPVEVLNSTGAGDAYMAGFLFGWIRDHGLSDCCRFGNACGAMVVSRHGCSSAMPSDQELKYFLNSRTRAAKLWEDARLNQLHRATQRAREWPQLATLAFDHRHQFEAAARKYSLGTESIKAAKKLIAEALIRSAGTNERVGAIIDEQYGAELLEQCTGKRFWLARPIEMANVTPLEFVGGPNVGLSLTAWPQEHVVKCLVCYAAAMPADVRNLQENRVAELFEACRSLERELLLEVLPPSDHANSFEISGVMRRFYELGICPDWWKIENPGSGETWQTISDTIGTNDPTCRGVILLGKGLPIPELCRFFHGARQHAICKGFAFGRSIFSQPVDEWMAGRASDEDCIAMIENNFESILKAWDEML